MAENNLRTYREEEGEFHFQCSKSRVSHLMDPEEKKESEYIILDDGLWN